MSIQAQALFATAKIVVSCILIALAVPLIMFYFSATTLLYAFFIAGLAFMIKLVYDIELSKLKGK